MFQHLSNSTVGTFISSRIMSMEFVCLFSCESSNIRHVLNVALSFAKLKSNIEHHNEGCWVPPGCTLDCVQNSPWDQTICDQTTVYDLQ